MSIIQLSMFDGKVCARCKEEKPRDGFHKSKRFRDGLRTWCKDCERAYNRAYVGEHKESVNKNRRRYDAIPENRQRRQNLDNQRYHANHDAIRARRKNAYGKNPEPIKASVRQYREQNPDKTKETSRKYWEKNRDQLKIKLRESYRKHHAARRAKARDDYAKNPEKTKEHARQWRVSNPEKRKIQTHRRRALRLAGGSYTVEQWTALCNWFGNICLACGSPNSLTVDHVIPLTKHGRNTIDNLQPLCFSCNSSKQAKAIDYRDPDRLAAFLEHIRCLEPTAICPPSSVDIH